MGLRGGLHPRPLEPDPVWTGVGNGASPVRSRFAPLGGCWRVLGQSPLPRVSRQETKDMGMQRRTFLATTLAVPLAAPLARPALAQASRARTLRFMPQAALANLDPIFSPSTIITTHGYCVFDTLYGANRALQPRPQMAEGHSVEDDGKLVKIRLRDGLRWHDGEPVRAADCVASIKRWASRDGFGQILMRATAELSAPDDRTIQFRLHRRFPALFDALAKPGASPCFMMPERIATIPGDRSLGLEHMIGSGPWRLIAGDYVQGSRSHYARNDAYVPRDEPAEAASAVSSRGT